MKKTLSLLLALVMCLSLCACGGDNDNKDNSSTTAQEQLTDLEKTLFNNLISITSEVFYEPAAVRVLEVRNYEEYSGTNLPATVVVRLQGENKAGGTLNHYYLICIKSGEASDADKVLNTWASLYGVSDPRYKEAKLKNKANEGEYMQLDDDYKASIDCSDTFNIGRINKALKEHWEEMGL